MPKQNSALLLNKYIWLIDTIYSAGHISRAERMLRSFSPRLSATKSRQK